MDPFAQSRRLVVDLSRLLPGGLCTQVMADLGADVVKVEMPGVGDHLRTRAPYVGPQDSDTASASFIGLNRNKRSLAIDLKAGEGRDALRTVIAGADVVVESFRPGVMDRLGLGYEELRNENPRLVMCSISGWGNVGTYSSRPGHDINYLAEAGLLSATGEVHEVPRLSASQIADFAVGLYGAIGILAALNERERSGTGQHVQVAAAQAALLSNVLAVSEVLATGMATSADEGRLSGGLVCYNIYRCLDGWVTLGALEQKFWSAWCHGVGRPDLLERRLDPTGSETHRKVREIMGGRTTADWERFASEVEACVSVVKGAPVALSSPLIRQAGIIGLFHQPGIPTPIETLLTPVHFSRTDVGGVRLPAPHLGQHSREVLTEAGLSDEQVADLLTRGVITEPEP